ncbi:ABC transporter ATP-binding protein [Brevibacterium litoralis]|uniref:ABC transporter ATP-binding protein n=1 Tax=Brevibacterium litoralis TaxID=3138935 RepID=UPI0032F02451
MKLIELLRRYLAPYRWLLVGVVVLQGLQVFGTLYLPTLNAAVVDDGVARGDTATVWRLGGIMLTVAAAQVVCNVAAVWCGARAAMAAGRNLRRDVFHRVTDMSHQDVARFTGASLITRNTNDINQVQMVVLMSATMLVMAPLMSIGGIVMALVQSVHLSWIVVVTVVVVAVVMGFLVRRMVPSFTVMQERIDGLNSVTRQQLTGIRVIRAFVRQGAERERFAEANTAVTDANLRVGGLFAILFPSAMAIINVATVAVVWFGAREVEVGTIEVGTIMAFVQYLMLVLMGIMMASFMAMMVPRAEVAAGRLTEVTDAELTQVSHGTVREFTERGAVAFENVTFRYPGAEAPVLDDISFRIPAGGSLAVVGSTGSGKTTFANVLTRLYVPESGTVSIGGVPVDELAPETLAGSMGIVPQQAYLFSGTIADNLRFSRPEATEDDMWWALGVAQADFVHDLADGLSHRVNQGGTNFSGGQRQRLAIARAVVGRPDVLVFDDSFSALDTATDSRLRGALSRAARREAALPEGSPFTRVIVAQRVATARDADRILVLDSGRVAGLGTHDELLADSPVYREIVESQEGHHV